MSLTKGLPIPLEEMVNAVDTMILLGGYDLFPPLQGNVWYDVLLKYAPSRAKFHLESYRGTAKGQYVREREGATGTRGEE